MSQLLIWEMQVKVMPTCPRTKIMTITMTMIITILPEEKLGAKEKEAQYIQEKAAQEKEKSRQDDYWCNSSPIRHQIPNRYRDRIFELSCEFAEAYFAQDFDSIRLFLSTDFVGSPKDACPWTGIDTYTVQGVDSISAEKANGTKVISIEFRNPDYPDSFVYLTIEFVKLDGEWKIHAYYL